MANLEPKKCTKSCSTETKQQLLRTKLAEGRIMLGGDIEISSLNEEFTQFLLNPKSLDLINLSYQRLQDEPAMFYFFEDIRNHARRARIVEIFLSAKNDSELFDNLKISFRDGSYEDIEHTRCFFADLIPLVLDESHNSFNNRMTRHPSYRQTLGNPYNNIAIRSPRLGKNKAILDEFVDIAILCSREAFDEKEIDITKVDSKQLERKFLDFRTKAAIKLQKLNPLFQVVESLAQRLDLNCSYLGTDSLLSDISGSTDPVGKYDLYHISDGAKTLLVNAIATIDQNGDHKSKEWGARRRSTLYRLSNGEIKPSEYTDALFIADGDWDQKDITRLYKSGWNHIIRLQDLEAKLREIFDIPESEAK